METSRQYRQQAADCLQLASEASDTYVKESLTELATEFRHRAEATEFHHRAEAVERRDDKACPPKS